MQVSFMFNPPGYVLLVLPNLISELMTPARCRAVSAPANRNQSTFFAPCAAFVPWLASSICTVYSLLLAAWWACLMHPGYLATLD